MNSPYQKAFTISLFTLFSATALGSGFQISETSVAGLGRAFAGNGVGGDSISDMFANPASLSLYSGRHVEVGAYVIDTNAQFENQGSTTRVGTTTFPASGPDSNGGITTGIPNFYYSQQLNDKLTFGLGVTAPFGLKTSYNNDWVGRYAAITSDLKTVDINPALAYKINDQFSVGGGVSYLHADVELTRALFTGPTTPDGFVDINGDDYAYGWNLGATYQGEKSRIGLSYRSEIDINPDGSVTIDAANINAGASASVTLPQTVYISGARELSDKLELFLGSRWTDWSSFQELRIQFDNGLPDNVTPENWDSTWTHSIGVNYYHSDKLTLRTGISYDESPVSTQFRTARIPDQDRFWLSLGASYQQSENLRFDFGYTHIFVDNASISEDTNLVATQPGAAVNTLNGEYIDGDTDIFGVAVSYSF